MFGCKSTDYIKRSLENNPTTSVLVVDHSLKALSNASAVLFPEFGTRVAFLRSDPMFTCLHILPSESTDVAIVPMPTPFRSQSSSHRRLFTCGFVCALHLILKKRESVSDDRGFVTFTDSQPLASFMLEQLDESKLIVPWKQKNPSNTFSSWIPKQSVSDDDESEPQVVKNFPKQRFPDLIALAAAKPEVASKQAIDLIYSYDYKRRHYNPLDQYSEESGV
ncbi:hypothetical protein AGDE_03127 [Angomonas deanei]|nr:hypothetical protein AGDE_03127 [Angomonas deanei]|eukprot:EPY40800.1 hypothetical protein AGDE_03127 [Angomonas deanei]